MKAWSGALKAMGKVVGLAALVGACDGATTSSPPAMVAGALTATTQTISTSSGAPIVMDPGGPAPIARLVMSFDSPALRGSYTIDLDGFAFGAARRDSHDLFDASTHGLLAFDQVEVVARPSKQLATLTRAVTLGVPAISAELQLPGAKGYTTLAALGSPRLAGLTLAKAGAGATLTLEITTLDLVTDADCNGGAPLFQIADDATPSPEALEVVEQHLEVEVPRTELGALGKTTFRDVTLTTEPDADLACRFAQLAEASFVSPLATVEALALDGNDKTYVAQRTTLHCGVIKGMAMRAAADGSVLVDWTYGVGAMSLAWFDPAKGLAPQSGAEATWSVATQSESAACR